MSVQEILRTYDCAVPGCPDEARERGGVCRYHQAENPPPATCKTPGCTNQTAGKGGPWKNYCQHHMSEEISRRRNVRHAKAPAAKAVKPPPVDGQPRRTPAAPKSPKAAAPSAPRAPKERTAEPPTLVRLAEQVEETRRAAADALKAHYNAKDALRAALDELDAAA